MSVLVGCLAGAAGLVLGGLVVQLLAVRRQSALQAEAAAASERAAQLAERLAAREAELAAERGRGEELTARAASAETARSALEERLAEEAARLREVQAQFRAEFENLANRILEEKSALFLTRNQEHLGLLLEPLRQRIGEFRDRIEIIHSEETRAAAALGEQLGQIRDLNRLLGDEAAALTRALKGESKTQGLWGEMVLERILEKSGLQKGVAYETQAHFRGTDGARFLPDVVVYLPEDHHLVIDAKVSLTAYARATAGDDPEETLAALKDHALSLRRHVEELARKDYPGLPGLRSPDFVLLFVPVEPALHAALQQDPALFSDAFDRNVVLVSSSTLLVTLRAVESVWRRQKQTLNALEIARQAGSLHDQFALFVEAMQEIGQRLDQARGAYDQALARLSTGRGNLVRRALELQKLGARAEKQIPPSVVQRADDEPDGP